MEKRKQALIQALQTEREHFAQRGQDTMEHDVAIDYLQTGQTEKNPEEFELLDACMNDFDLTCKDYGV